MPLINQNYTIMGTLEIFDKLKNIENVSLLEKIRSLLKSVDSSEIYQLKQCEIDVLKKSEEDLKYGRVISQENLE